MRKKAANQKNETTNVEFGIEFGDMNASKMFEVPFMNEKEGKTKKSNKKK